MKLLKLFLAVIIIIVLCFVGYFFLVNKKVNIKLVSNANIAQEVKPEGLTGDSLLVQINKQHCLADNYVPKDLVNISNYGISENGNFMLRKIVFPDLNSMVVAANKEGINLKVVSAYRSYQDQVKTYKGWVKQLGLQEANRQSAPPGCSQHQLGTAIDFNELDGSFANTPAGIWLAKNAWQYGWVISYPLNSENVTGYAYEPWHYRYIGIDNALEMKNSGLILSKYLDTKNNF